MYQHIIQAFLYSITIFWLIVIWTIPSDKLERTRKIVFKRGVY